MLGPNGGALEPKYCGNEALSRLWQRMFAFNSA